MILYHTSSEEIRIPDTIHSRDALDFGKGFYLTTLHQQAVKYGRRFKLRNKPAILNVYELDFDPTEWKIKTFDSYNFEWLDFISKCRAGIDDSDFDMIIGGIADDEVFSTLEDYFSGKIDAEKALGQLTYAKPNNQYCIRSQAMLNKCLKHKESKPL